MKQIIVVNGENYWQEFFPDYKVTQIKIQSSQWIVKHNKLYVIFDNQIFEPSGILWRVGAIHPTPIQQTALRLIALTKTPCINQADTLLKGFDRLSMLYQLQQCGLPTLDCNIISHSALSKNLTQDFPFVIKAGNYHGGFGKVLVQNEANWQDIQDLLFTSEDYVVAEPYIDYVRDIRYLVVGENVWAMARKGKFWKANVETTDFALIDTVNDWVTAIKKAQFHLQADVLALDIIEDKNGNYFVMEYNDIPGISGFPEIVKSKIADLLIKQMTT